MNYKTLICALFLTFPGAKSAFLILSALPDGLVGAKSAFPIPFDPLKPYSKAPPGSNLGNLIPSALPDGLVGAKSAFPIPFSPLTPYSKAPPGAKSPFLSPQTLPDGFAGSNSAFLSPQPLSDAACLGFVKFTCNILFC